MIESRRPRILTQLRRSVWLAMFALAVFVLRVGVVAACAPEDLAELLPHAADTVQAAADTAGDDDSAHVAGHCLHCSCHHAVTLPASLAPIPGVTMAFDAISPRWPQANAPPELSLRPPIA